MLTLENVAQELLQQHPWQLLVEALEVHEEAAAALEDLAEDGHVLELSHAADEGQLDLVDDVDVDEEDEVEVALEGGDQDHGLAALLLCLGDVLEVGVGDDDLVKDLLEALMEHHEHSLDSLSINLGTHTLKENFAIFH